MGIIAGVSCRHPHSVYAGLQKSLQQEWAFLQRVTPGIKYVFVLLEKALRETFLPALFEGLEGGGGAPEKGVTRLPLKQAGLDLPYLTLNSLEILDVVLCNHMTPCRSSQGPGGVPDCRPLGLLPRGTYGGSEEDRTLV